MPGDFNHGRDLSLDFIGPNNTPVSIAILTDFDSKQDMTAIKSAGIDGVTRHFHIPDGWSGSLKLDRASRSVDDLVATLEAQYYAGGTSSPLSIVETIREVDGTISQWRYEGVRIKLDDAGKWRKDAKTEQSLSFSCSFKKPVQ